MSYIDGEGLEAMRRSGRPSERMDIICSLMRDAVDKSSIGVYNGLMYYFNGCIYEPLDGDLFGDLIYSVMKRVGVPYGDFGKIESVIRVCRRRVKTKRLSVNKRIVVFRNCVFDTVTFKRKPFHRDYVQFCQLPYDYDGRANCYLWERFLSDVLPQATHRKLLQQFLGSLFINRSEAKMETLLILLGNGANGKSVIFETVRGVLGEGNVSSFGLDELIGGGTERKRNIAAINGKRLNYCSEARQMKIDSTSGTLKALISGEPMTARALYGENFMADELPQIMVNTNTLPRLEDWSTGMKRRLVIIPFDVEIPLKQQNRELPALLRAEYPAIFNWMMEGMKEFMKQGYNLIECAELKYLLEEYESESNSAAKFMISRNYRRDFDVVAELEPVWFPLPQLYREYSQWCLLQFEERYAIRTFSQKLKMAGFRRRRSINGTEIAVYSYEALTKLKKEITLEKRKKWWEDFRNKVKPNPLFSEDLRAEMETEAGQALIFGCNELAQYLGVKESTIKTELRKGCFEGMYVLRGSTHIFFLDAVERKWLPDWTDRKRQRDDVFEELRRKAQAEKENEVKGKIKRR